MTLSAETRTFFCTSTSTVKILTVKTLSGSVRSSGVVGATYRTRTAFTIAFAETP